MYVDNLQVVNVARTPWHSVFKSNFSANSSDRVKLTVPALLFAINLLHYVSFLPKKLKYPIEMSNIDKSFSRIENP